MLSNDEISDIAMQSGAYDEQLSAFARAIEAKVLEKLQAQSEPVNWNWVDLQNRADEIVRGKVLWKRFIDGTPLANDIACWMADFAQEVAAAPVQAQSEPVAWMGAYDNTDLYYRKPTQADVVPLYRHPAPVQAQSEPDTCQMCGDKPHPGCNSEFQGEKTCRFWAAPVQHDMRLKNLQDSHNALAESHSNVLKKNALLEAQNDKLKAQNKILLEALKAIADYPELDALEMKREARAAIAQVEGK